MIVLTGLHSDLNWTANNVAGELGDGVEVMLTQPVAGEAVGGLKAKLAFGEATASHRPKPGFKRGLTEAALESVLHLVPQLTAAQQRSFLPSQVGNLRKAAGIVRLS